MSLEVGRAVGPIEEGSISRGFSGDEIVFQSGYSLFVFALVEWFGTDIRAVVGAGINGGWN